MTDKHRPNLVKWVLAALSLPNLVKFVTTPWVDENRAMALFRPTATGPPHDASVPSLLHPERSPVPFMYRDEDLKELERWCYDDAGRGVRWKLVTGESGRGKTRLLMELITTLRADAGRPWHAGFLDMAKLRANPTDLECFQRLPGDLLFVVDYAERFEPEVRALLKASLKLADAKPPRRVRVVLISRRNSELWQKIGERDSGEEISDAMGSDCFSTFELQPLGHNLAARNLIFNDAYAAFEKHFGESRPLGHRPDLNQSGFGEIVLIQLAALSLFWGEMEPALMSEDALLDWVLARERRRWNETVENILPGAGVQDAPIEQAAAYLTFVSLGAGVKSRDRTAALLENCPLLKNVGRPALSAVGDIFRDLYPGSGWVNGLTPDLVGTYLLNVMDDDSFGIFMSGLTETEATNGLTKLNWVAQRWPESGRRKLEAAIAANPSRVFPLAIRVAVESGDPIGRIAATWLETNPDRDLAEDLEPTIPFPTIALREMAEVVQAILYTATAGAKDEVVLADHARHAHNRSVRLSELGRLEAALAAAEEALEIYHKLAVEQPDAFLPDIAMSLSNLGNQLSELGRQEAALAAAKEAVEIHRKLAAERPDAFLSGLAGGLNNLGNHLAKLGRRNEALAAAEEALEIHRRLAAERPDTFIPNLAVSLNNLGNHLSNLGRQKEALAVAEEALEIDRRLAEERPDAFLPDLAMSLNNLSTRLSDLGRREAALVAIEEGLEIYRRLAVERPDVFLPNLAMSLNNLGPYLSNLGRREAALAAAEEALDIRRRLAAERPDAFLPDLAMSLNNLGNHLSDLGRREAALAVAEEALDIRRRLAAERPDAFLPDLAMSLNNLGGFLSGLGRQEEALAATKEAAGIYRELAEDRPDAFLSDLAMSLHNMSGDLSDLGRWEEALAAADEALEIYRRLAEGRPDVFLPDLAQSFGVLGHMRRGLKDYSGARSAFADGIRSLVGRFDLEPMAHARLMAVILGGYAESCKGSGEALDEALVAPIIKKLNALSGDDLEETGPTA